ncbi:putative enzyme [Rhodovastum atsumiense]|nr:methyltransferase domain-containing protein [Rhodovastum atsumiense]CAH2602967.1 putative enzyme [Rhodovastum atsumiense]
MDVDADGDFTRQVNALRWFHQIDFGNGVLSPGVIKAPKIRRMAKLIFDRPLAGRSVLDIGCWDGAYSIEAVRRGAARVLATDHYVWHEGWGDRRALDLARSRLAPQIEVLDAPVEALTEERVGRFDIVLFCGLFYHLRHPFAALEQVATLAKEVLVVESRIVAPFSRRPFMRFYPGAELDGDPTNWWAPNRACMEALLRDLGFRHIRFRRPDWRWRRGMFHAER